MIGKIERTPSMTCINISHFNVNSLVHNQTVKSLNLIKRSSSVFALIIIWTEDVIYVGGKIALLISLLIKASCLIHWDRDIFCRHSRDGI